MQMSFSELEYATKKKRTRRDRFLSEIEAITPWAALIATKLGSKTTKLGSGLAKSHPTLYSPFMTRSLRIELSGGLYHVTSRGDRREDIYSSDADREAWLSSSIGSGLAKSHHILYLDS